MQLRKDERVTNRLYFSLFFSVIILCCKAQEVVPFGEPEFAEQSVIQITDSFGVMLPRENAYIKAKSSASLYLVGIGMTKARITLSGARSSVSVGKRDAIHLIIKAVDNITDPSSFINVFKFEVKSNKRQFQVSEVGTFNGSSNNSLGSINFSAKKYGESSYLISLYGLEDGEYGISIGNPNSMTEKNLYKITTFSIGERKDNAKRNKRRNQERNDLYFY